MIVFNPKVDLYLLDGCGRCAYFATPRCKVKKWHFELAALRQIVLETGLVEELKWKIPVYTFENKNTIIVSAFKDFCSINFLKGVLLKDSNNILEKQGESSQSARIVKFTNVEAISKLTLVLKEYINEAILLEKNGAKVTFTKNLEPIPIELENIFVELPIFKTAFYSLTPGKQRAYIIYFSQPKQTKTRISRIQNKIPNILNGEGINDNYKSKRS